MGYSDATREAGSGGQRGLGLRIIMAAALMGVTASMTMAQQDSGNVRNGGRTNMITVSGTGLITAVPDIAQINAGVTQIGKTAAAALSANSAAMRAVIDKLKSAGIKARDIQTSNLTVRPRQQHFRDGRPPRVTGYQVTNEVHITARDLDRLGEVLDSVVVAGANQIHGISFALSKAGKLKDKARGEAVMDARRKAELYAKAAGASLGKVISIVESGSAGPRPPVVMARAAAREAVPIERGSQTLEVRVQVSWALK